MKYLAPLMAISIILLAGCDIDPLTDAINDFNIVVELEDINTGFSVGVFDYETKAIIDSDVTITFDSLTALHTVDIFSTPLPQKTFDGGFINVGIQNDQIPTGDNPFYVSGILSADGYLDKEFSLSLTDTGAFTFDIDLISESNPPTNYYTETFIAPLDSAGNPLPFPDPTPEEFSTNKLSHYPEILSSKNLLLPRIVPMDGVDMSEVTWHLDNGQSFTGYPAEYSMAIQMWNPDTPEYNSGFMSNEEKCGDLFLPPDNVCRNIARNNGYLRTIIKMNKLQVKGSHTEFSTIKKLTLPDSDKLFYVFIKTLALTPNQDSNWHEAVRKQTRGFYSLSYPKYIEKEYLSEPYLDWTRRDTLKDSMSNGITEISDPYFYHPGDMLSDKYIGFTYALINADLMEFSQGNPLVYAVLASRPISAAVNTGTVNVTFSNTNQTNIRSVKLQADGSFFTGWSSGSPSEYHFYSVPKGPANVIVTLPHTTYTVTVDFSNQNSISITLPTVPDNLVNATVKANIACTDPNSYELNLNSFPVNNVAIRYNKEGETGVYPRVATVTAMNYNKNRQVLESVDVSIPGLEIGQQYEFTLSVDSFSDKTTQLIESDNFEIDVTIENKFCQTK